jgi:imidazolonepropionase-like amidohydrolase
MAVRSVIRNARLWDGVADDLIDGGEVLIEDGRVVEAGRVRTALQVEEIDAGGRFVMPGLIDGHFHAYWGPPSIPEVETLPLSYLAHHASRLLTASLRRGFTTIRDAGGADWGLWRAAEDGLFEAPRLFYAGRALSQTGGHGDSRAQHHEPCSCRFIANLSETADGIDEVRKAARETLRRGAHHLKIFLSGGVVSPTDPIWMRQYSDAEVRAAVEEASSRRTYVMAHAYTAEAAMRAAKCGVRSVEHGNLIDERAAQAMAAAGAFLVPTLVTYHVLSREGAELGLGKESLRKLADVAEKGAGAVKLARAAGVQVGFGTDLAGPAHHHQRDEFRLRAETDAPIDILRSATSVNAEMMMRAGEIGTIAPGAFADLIAVEGDPREDLSCLFADAPQPALIMKGGRVISQAA